MKRSDSNLEEEKQSSPFNRLIKCTCLEAILIVDDTEYNLLPLIHYIGQLRIQMRQSKDILSNPDLAIMPRSISEEEIWMVSEGPPVRKCLSNHKS
jgi:hypothetical protein